MSSEPFGGRRVWDQPRNHVVDLIDALRWPITVIVLALIAVVAGCWFTDRPIQGLLSQLLAVGLITGPTSCAVVALRVIAAIRQWSDASRNSGRAATSAADALTLAEATREDVAALREILETMGAGSRGTGARRADTAPHDTTPPTA